MYSMKLASVETQYEKDKCLKKSDVEAVFEWLKKQPHLPELTELQVVLFLQSCYYSIEASKKAIDTYFTMRTHLSYLFEHASEEVIRETLNAEFIQVFPKRTPQDYIVLLMKLKDMRPEKYVNINSMKLGLMSIILHLHQYGPAEGFILLTDTKGVTLSHLTRANIMAVKHVAYFGQEGLPIRIKGLHYINAIPVTERMVQFIKPFIKSDLVNMINMHSSIDTLYKFIPKESLPEDYGGELPDLQTLHDENLRNLLDNLDFFKWHDSQKVDEAKRCSKSENPNAVFGMEGTFKKLEID